MTARIRLALAVAALLAPPALFALRSAPRAWSAPPLERAIPGAIGPYLLADRIRLEPEITATVRPSDYLFWQYQAAGKPAVVAYVAAYANIRDLGVGAHDPRLCYPAQGWEILATEETSVPLADGAHLRATLMQSEQAGRRELVLFWVQPAGRWPAAPALEQLLGLRDAFVGSDRYVFVRLSTPGDAAGDAQQLADFAAALAPRVRSFLDAAGA